ncbi:hypothetical protein, partial [Mycolicibacterium vinylchloridicum]|uniref:hypothetical protein n=1 Tax=Mycolicibacterium vinylchloridicum TaxID=2736928 RepID=UPI001C54A7E1
KTPTPTGAGRIRIRTSLKPNKDTKTGITNTTPQHGGTRMRQKNNKQKPPNTLLSSQTTHPAPSPAAQNTPQL